MHSNEMDGEISNVNPSLLELAKDPEAWKEQRRRAMREKIFGGGGTTTSNESNNNVHAAYMPIQRDVAPPSASGPATRSQDEAYVLQQIMSHKRRRDVETAEPTPFLAQPTAPAPAQQMSMKDRLMQKYSKD